MIIRNMRQRVLKFILFLSLLFTLPLAHAGAGIVYGTESISVEDEGQHCVQYGLYNPWEGNVTLSLSAGGEIAKFASQAQEIFVPSLTYHDKAIGSELCFAPQVFAKDCLIGNFFLCRKTCPEEAKSFKGEVLVTEVRAAAGGGTGSAASASASAPLSITVTCKPYERNWFPVIALSIIIVISIVAILVIKQLRKPVTHAKKLAKYRKMQERLKKMKKRLK
jgi:hypothetical protein